MWRPKTEESKAAKLNFDGKIFFDLQYQYFSVHINILRKLDLSRFIIQKQKFIKINIFVKKHRYDFKIDHHYGNVMKKKFGTLYSLRLK